jgi:hypothetical protein
MKIELTALEIEMAQLLEPFIISPDESYGLRISKLKVSARLTQSLLDRNAIPKVRIKYFTQPEYNLPTSRKSRQQVFEHNGKSGSRIFEDPAFLKYLRYFIYGADLPWELKVDLQAAKSNAYYENEFVDEAYSIVKRHRPAIAIEDEVLAEEIFKYTLDIGTELSACKGLWEKVRKIES